MSEKVEHWNAVYEAREEEHLTWYENQPKLSCEVVTKYLQLGEGFIDIGGGASKLTSILHAAGYGPLAVLDISPVVLEVAKERLDGVAGDVEWINADITAWLPPHTFRVWHDRAVFHFLTVQEDRKAYVDALMQAIPIGGIAIIASFAEDGPEKCSGLPVQRYSPKSLSEMLNSFAPAAFELIASKGHTHITPRKTPQSFQSSVFKRISEAGNK